MVRLPRYNKERMIFGAILEREREREKAKANRNVALCTGYVTFFPHVGDYNLDGAPMSWTKVVAMRHALTKFPDATYFWYLDLDTFVMNPTLAIEHDIMTPAKLEEKMIVDHPVVPPDSIIHTFAHLHGQDVDLVITQDKEGLVPSSFVVRNTEWSRFLLETWYDPIYRSYNFQKAEKHALVSTCPASKLLLDAIVSCSKKLTDGTTGTHCPMAPHDPLETGPPTPADAQCLQQTRKGSRIPDGRLGSPLPKLHEITQEPDLRKAGRGIHVSLDDGIQKLITGGGLPITDFPQTKTVYYWRSIGLKAV